MQEERLRERTQVMFAARMCSRYIRYTPCACAPVLTNAEVDNIDGRMVKVGEIFIIFHWWIHESKNIKRTNERSEQGFLVKGFLWIHVNCVHSVLCYLGTNHNMIFRFTGRVSRVYLWSRDKQKTWWGWSCACRIHMYSTVSFTSKNVLQDTHALNCKFYIKKCPTGYTCTQL